MGEVSPFPKHCAQMTGTHKDESSKNKDVVHVYMELNIGVTVSKVQ